MTKLIQLDLLVNWTDIISVVINSYPVLHVSAPSPFDSCDGI